MIGADDLRFRPTDAITKDTIYVTSDGRVRMNGTGGDAAAFSNVMLSVGKASNANPSGDYSLWLTGGAVKPGGGGFGDSSDLRLKKQIEPISGSLDKLLGLRSVSYKLNKLDNGLHGDKTFLGFLAREFEPVFPIGSWTVPTGTKMLNIQGFESLAVQALRELRLEKDTQVKALEDGSSPGRATGPGKAPGRSRGQGQGARRQAGRPGKVDHPAGFGAPVRNSLHSLECGGRAGTPAATPLFPGGPHSGPARTAHPERRGAGVPASAALQIPPRVPSP